jgi:hypothetical protein
MSAQPIEMSDVQIADEILDTLGHLLLAARERRSAACSKFENYEMGMIHAMKKNGLKELEHSYGGRTYKIKRRTVNAVECSSCHAPKEVPDWVPKDWKPERLTISLQKEATDD